MKIRPLILGPEQKAAIAAAMAKARKAPVPVRAMLKHSHEYKPTLTLADRKGKPARNRGHISLPIGYEVYVSYEEQPAGLTIHVSISVNERGKTPNPEAAKMILAEFGVPWAGWARAWIEEFERGHHAINFLHIVEPRQKGTA